MALSTNATSYPSWETLSALTVDDIGGALEYKYLIIKNVSKMLNFDLSMCIDLT